MFDFFLSQIYLRFIFILLNLLKYEKPNTGQKSKTIHEQSGYAGFEEKAPLFLVSKQNLNTSY
jgi:hypothetical protein